jgi:hypothetical protein
MNQTRVKETKERMRPLEGKTLWFANITAVLFALFYIYTAGFGLISTEMHRGAYILFTMLLCFTLYPLRKKTIGNRVPLIDWALCIIAAVAITYWIVEFPSYALRVRNPTQADIVMGIAITILSLEVARRTINLILPALALVFLMYAYFGYYVPGVLGHPGFSIVNIVESIACDVGGIYGIVANTYATFVFPFIIFASFLKAAGAGDAVESLALAIAGGTRGGPAKVAVVSSGIIGSITGSSAANAVATGAYTIPLMKKTGYKSHVAAGVEAAASSGGQMLPPVMGAGAFLLATFTETAYVDLIKIAAIPAVLYFLGVGMMVHFIAGREGLKGIPKEDLPRLKDVILQKGYLLLPIIVILVLLVGRYSFWCHRLDHPFELCSERDASRSSETPGRPHLGREELIGGWGNGWYRGHYRGHPPFNHHPHGCCLLYHGYGFDRDRFICGRFRTGRSRPRGVGRAPGRSPPGRLLVCGDGSGHAACGPGCLCGLGNSPMRPQQGGLCGGQACFAAAHFPVSLCLAEWSAGCCHRDDSQLYHWIHRLCWDDAGLLAKKSECGGEISLGIWRLMFIHTQYFHRSLGTRHPWFCHVPESQA